MQKKFAKTAMKKAGDEDDEERYSTFKCSGSSSKSLKAKQRKSRQADSSKAVVEKNPFSLWVHSMPMMRIYNSQLNDLQYPRTNEKSTSTVCVSTVL
jgi:hypothetical protein